VRQKKQEMLFPGSSGSDCGKALAQMAAINSLLQKADWWRILWNLRYYMGPLPCRPRDDLQPFP